ncbi:MAG TPA: phosphoribosyltransferase family protein [Candidatus Eisenbacteria bacterium]|jgi:ComF family protein|nr:phosphoribosyltransferase family protein [Candidatus Eisenbacteria bacterium]
MESEHGDLAAEMTRRCRKALSLLAAAAFPHFCCSCGTEGKIVCGGCAADAIAPLKGIFVCPGCGVPSPLGALCGRPKCRKATPLDGSVAAASYGSPVPRELLRLCKYERVSEARDALAAMFAAFARRHAAALEEITAGGVIVPVPMHPFREAYRGFNQATILAETLGRETGTPVSEVVLKRRFRWSTQAVLEDDGARRMNARGSVIGRAVKEGSSFVLVDDVATTGATLAACARALKDGGAGRVWAVTLLRGSKNRPASRDGVRR